MSGHGCNDYMIKDGTFVRNFEGMYQAFEDPWGQRGGFSEDLMNTMALFLLKAIVAKEGRSVGNVLDIGCADGYYVRSLLELAGRGGTYTGTDISPTVVARAAKNAQGLPAQFVADDIVKANPSFAGKYDLIFSAKTLYYVAPEIDQVLANINSYIKKGGIFCFTYNQRKDSFTNQWLTYSKLREKVLRLNYKELYFVEINRDGDEAFAIGIFRSEGSK